MKNVVVRAISGAIYVAILVGAILAGKTWLAVLLCLFSAIGMWELTNMVSKKIARFALILDIAAGIMLILSSYFYFRGFTGTASGMAVLFLAFMIMRMISQLYSVNVDSIGSNPELESATKTSNGTQSPLAALSNSLMSQIYIALPLALIPMLRTTTSPHTVLAILIFIWVNDTGAFCTGSLIGRHKLFERISPKKTWEGFLGGLVFCIAAAFIMLGFFSGYFGTLADGHTMTYLQMALLGFTVSIVATFGDLLESMIKRTVGVKDSGNIIPGHGGILDRIDSLLLVIPASVIFFALI